MCWFVVLMNMLSWLVMMLFDGIVNCRIVLLVGVVLIVVIVLVVNSSIGCVVGGVLFELFVVVIVMF